MRPLAGLVAQLGVGIAQRHRVELLRFGAEPLPGATNDSCGAPDGSHSASGAPDSAGSSSSPSGATTSFKLARSDANAAFASTWNPSTTSARHPSSHARGTTQIDIVSVAQGVQRFPECTTGRAQSRRSSPRRRALVTSPGNSQVSSPREPARPPQMPVEPASLDSGRLVARRNLSVYPGEVARLGGWCFSRETQIP